MARITRHSSVFVDPFEFDGSIQDLAQVEFPIWVFLSRSSLADRFFRPVKEA